ncbi:hypothetical protein IWW36_000921 [Coemansia brasiliensis]|uniref:SET domain-containing protein n=1 Tax=Coemansia brasiliensis TaxID=2650707 RepID=A0A9W8ICW5_9FUNG|nr:hypothetical protein IWW36_000921 [Coemansia brasiliensis]
MGNQQKLARFAAWLEENGVQMDKLELRQSEKGNGIYAKEALSKDEQYIQLPHHLIITSRVCRDALSTDSWTPKFEGTTLLHVFLIHQRFVAEKSSFWHPFIDVLPTEFQTPLFFTGSELDLLKNTNIPSATEEQRASLQKTYQEALVDVPESVVPRDVLTFENYVWAAMVVMTRTFTGQILAQKEESDIRIMLPFMDMLNHDFQAKVEFNDTEKTLNLATCIDISQGDEVCYSYGPKSNDELLLGYGFIIPNNPYNRYTLRLNYTQDPLAIEKQELLNRAGITLSEFHLQIGELPKNLLSLVRVMCMNDADVFYAKQEDEDSAVTNLGLRLELGARFMLALHLENKIALLQQEKPKEMSANARLALEYRQGIVDILQYAQSELKLSILKLLGHACQVFTNLHSLPSYICKDGQPLPLDVIEDSSRKRKRADEVDLIQNFIDNVLITEESFAKDSEFQAAAEQIDAEPDVLLTLFILRIRMCPNLPWHKAVLRLEPFKHPMLAADNPDAMEMYGEMMMEMGEIHDTLFPLLTNLFPKVFAKEYFTADLFLWAAGIVESFQLQVPARQLYKTEYDEKGLCLV